VNELLFQGSNLLVDCCYQVEQDPWWKLEELATQEELDMLGDLWDTGCWRDVLQNTQVIRHTPRLSFGAVSRVSSVRRVAMSGCELMVQVQVISSKVLSWTEVKQLPSLFRMAHEYLTTHTFSEMRRT